MGRSPRILIEGGIQLLERAFYDAQIRQDVFQYEDEVALHWPDGFRGNVGLTIRVQSPAADIYSEGEKTAAAGAPAIMGTAYQFPDGSYDLFLMPNPEELSQQLGIAERLFTGWQVDIQHQNGNGDGKNCIAEEDQAL